jgi:O-antigen/teichoic acid export membrane protein
MAALSQLAGLSVASVIGPAMANDPEGSRPALRISLRSLLALYALLGVLILGLGDRIVLALFGDDYSGCIPSLRVFALIIPLMGMSPIFSLVLNYGGKAKRRVVFVLFAMILTVVGNVILIPRIGILGSALAMALGQFVYVGVQGIYCSRIVPLERFWSPLFAKISVISLGSLVVIVLARSLFPGDPAAWAAGVLATLVYGIALFRWGILSRAELLHLVPKGLART